MGFESNFLVVADESGTHAGPPCFTIGVFLFSQDEYERHVNVLNQILNFYGVDDELKWWKIGSFRKRSDAALDGVSYLVDSGVEFASIVVNKGMFRKWRSDHEAGFYHAYYELSKHLASSVDGSLHLKIDDRDDAYAKQTDVLEIITNHVLVRRAVTSRIASVEKVNSKDLVALQYIDVLTGAINSDTAVALDPGQPMNDGKKRLAHEIASLFGWDSLRYDTMPNPSLDIWHFPIESRGPTRQVALASRVIPALQKRPESA